MTVLKRSMAWPAEDTQTDSSIDVMTMQPSPKRPCVRVDSSPPSTPAVFLPAPSLDDAMGLPLSGDLPPRPSPDTPQLDEQHLMVFLQRLSRNSFVSGGLPEAFQPQVWRCFAEFNLLMEAHFPALPASSIRGYHSFTRAPKQQLAQRYDEEAVVQQQQRLQAAGQGGSGASMRPLQAQMVMFILETAYGCYHQAGIVKYLIEAPEWLHAWLHRWGLAAGAERGIHVTAVHAYAPRFVGGATEAAAEGPIRVIFVPCFGE